MPSKNPSKKPLLLENLLRTLLRSVLLHDPLGVHPSWWEWPPLADLHPHPPSRQNQLFIDLPRKQKIGVKKCWVRESEIGETILGVNFGREFFFGGLKSWKKTGRKIRGQNSPSKFAGKFPKIRPTKIKISPQIRSADADSLWLSCLDFLLGRAVA